MWVSNSQRPDLYEAPDGGSTRVQRFVGQNGAGDARHHWNRAVALVRYDSCRLRADFACITLGLVDWVQCWNNPTHLPGHGGSTPNYQSWAGNHSVPGFRRSWSTLITSACVRPWSERTAQKRTSPSEQSSTEGLSRWGSASSRHDRLCTFGPEHRQRDRQEEWRRFLTASSLSNPRSQF
jgi:hypothetical protein